MEGGWEARADAQPNCGSPHRRSLGWEGAVEYLIPFWILCGVAGGAMLSRYNKAGTGFLLGLLFGPIGLIIAWTMRDTSKLDEAKDASGARTVSGEQRVERECPHCAERILVQAKVCKHC